MSGQPKSGDGSPRVYNKYHGDAPDDAVYIGRPGPWGNQFVIGRDGTREECVAKYESWLANNPDVILRAIVELRGRDLVCFCDPAPCHGHILVRVANI